VESERARHDLDDLDLRRLSGPGRRVHSCLVERDVTTFRTCCRSLRDVELHLVLRQHYYYYYYYYYCAYGEWDSAGCWRLRRGGSSIITTLTIPPTACVPALFLKPAPRRICSPGAGGLSFLYVLCLFVSIVYCLSISCPSGWENYWDYLLTVARVMSGSSASMRQR
jgi:hypothetical protein